VIQMDSIPSFGRSACTCFSINGKGYIGTGATNGNALTDEWWEFSPDSLNQWTQKINFPGGPRKVAAGFELNGKGYVIAGIDTDLVMHKDVWEYDPIGNSWLPKNNFPGTPRFYAKGMNVNSTGYIMTGWDSTQLYTNDLWKYNEGSDSWTALDTIPAVGRKGVSVFTVNGNIFVTTGINHDNDRLTETWAYGESIGLEKWENGHFKIFPNPSSGEISIFNLSNTVSNSIKIINALGLPVKTFSNITFPIRMELSAGIYFIIYQLNDQDYSQKFIIR